MKTTDHMRWHVSSRVLARSVARRVLRHYQGRKPTAPYYPLSTRPLVLLANDWAFVGAHQPLYSLLRAIGSEPTLILYNPSWHLRTDSQFDRIRSEVGRVLSLNNHSRVVILAANEPTRATLRERGLPSFLLNQNALADERVFKPLGLEQTYDAVYDAKMAPFKRHELASEIDNLALITYQEPAGLARNLRYARSVRKSLANAHWFNPPGRSGFLRPEQVNRALNRSRVGLCLSETEGTMWASVQYLLAGLPVVTTPSQGGRDEFFHSDYVATVAPAPAAVAQAVARAARTGPPGEEIRRRTLELMVDHRNRLVNIVDEFLAENGEGRTFRDAWEEVQLHHFFYWQLKGFRALGRIRSFNLAIAEAVRQRRPYIPEAELARHGWPSGTTSYAVTE